MGEAVVAGKQRASRRRVPVSDDALRTSREIDPAFDLEAFLPFQLSVVANRVSQTVGRAISDRFSLQVPEWRILVVLGKYGSLTALEIARKTSMDKARVSRAQHRLVDLGLAGMQPSADDRRKVIVTLAADGRQLYRDMAPLAHEVADRLFVGLTAGERVALRSVMRKLFASTSDFEPMGDEAV